MSDQMNYRLHPASGGVPITLVADFGLFDPANAQFGRTSATAAGELASLGGATAWLNSEPLAAADLRGKVVLVNFWTYTCINWLRTLPYVRAWAEKYRDQGLVVIGAHTPEFPFEYDIENVRQAVKDRRIEYPIAVDNDYAVWTGFSNHYWPALYLFDVDGQIRDHHFGEGDYVRSEVMIQRLLAEAGLGSADIGNELVSVSVDAQGVEAEADWGDEETPETYLGHARTERFASPGGLAAGDRHSYEIPERLKRNQWALSGNWTVDAHAAVLNAANGRIAYRFHARDVHLVMGPTIRGTSVRFRVLVDGTPPRAAHGLDVDEQGNGTVADQRLYQLIRQSKPIVDRQFEIEFLDAGVEACAFTFG